MRPYMRAANVTWAGLYLDDVKQMDFSPEEYEIFALRRGDVLVGEASGSKLEVGKSVVWREEIPGACFQNTLIRVRPGEAILSEYLQNHLQHDALRGGLAEVARGIGIHHLGAAGLAEWEIAVPPMPEQQRIAAKLKSLLARVDACRQRLDRVPAILKRFRQSVLASATSGELTSQWREERSSTDGATSWTASPLADLCRKGRVITYGVIKLGDEIPDGVPCLRTSNVRWLRFEVGGIKRIAPKLSAEYGRTVLQGGEVLVNVRGTLGGVAVADESMSGWNVSREVAVVPTDAKRVLPKYLAFWIGADSSQRWLAGVEKGVTYTGINIEDLRTLPVSLPPLEEQQEIVRRVEELLQLADRVDLRYRAAMLRLSSAPRAVLAKAFRGELVPQDPNDEPASELLNRIHAEAASRTKPRDPTPMAKRRARTKSAPEVRGRRRAAQ